MTDPNNDQGQQQLGVRVDASLAVDVKVLAVKQRRRFKELVEEAFRDLLKKYRDKAKTK